MAGKKYMLSQFSSSLDPKTECLVSGWAQIFSRFYYAYVIFFVTLCIYQGNAHSAEKTDFGSQQIAAAFLQAATSKSNGAANAFPYLLPAETFQEHDPLYNPEYFRIHYPWLYPYVYFGKEVPKFMAINKWKQPIRISLGLPNDLKPYNSPRYKGRPLTDYPEWPNVIDENGYSIAPGPFVDPAYNKEKLNPTAIKIISDEIRFLAPTISALTNIDVSFVEQEQKENGGALSNMRVVLVDSAYADYWDTQFKKGSRKIHSHGFRDSIERKLNTAVHFTPIYAQYQVDGFFIPNSKNEIQFSVCYIRDDNSELILKKLVRECLIRSLGFPEGQNIINQSALFYWNDPDVVQTHISQAPEVNKPSHFDEMDEYFVRLLYSNALRPGMTFPEVFNEIISIVN